MKTILITGTSSGFGLETAKTFLERGWNVIATMRIPNLDVLPASDALRILPLDVTDDESIARLVAAAGPIDVLVNNAGIGMLGALEGTSMSRTRDLFATNTFGTIAMTQAILPQFRARRDGVVINVTSSVTLKPLRLLSSYTASKAAVNAFTESLALELAPFNIRTHVVLPGRAPSTDFGKNVQPFLADAIPEAYQTLAQSVFADWQADPVVTEVEDVVEAIWRAATDPSSPLRILAGADAVALAA